MRTKGVISIIIFLFSLTGSSQDVSLFHSEFEKEAFSKNDQVAFELMLASDPTVTQDKFDLFHSDFNSLIDQLKFTRSKSKSDLAFLEKMFYKVHRKRLGWYTNYVTLTDVFENKKYDCLTGTALFSLILDEMSIEYKILEFDFHIFLVAQIEGQEILIEATDPLTGFVVGSDEILKRINHSQYNVDVDSRFHQTFIKNEIDLIALAGLQYYNLAVKHFNTQEYKKASQFIKKADLLYPDERVRNTRELISSASL